MKILAVIPARAGSKGIPNKNIRILNEKPLISYSISNALNSKYIDDVVVTTDSEQVRIIAEQMGANVRIRPKELCGDSITLDSVIYDAIPENSNYDYIITLQPTSPTLKISTLDSAIQYAIDNNLDTLISAINAPHLSWKEENGKKVPNYKERLNRQYLPANYLETGAFVISKREVVKPNTRIGNLVDVYEVNEIEAIDIDNFQDLYLSSYLMQNKKVAIYANGNNKIGTGHIYRSLELADEFYSKPDIIYDINQTDTSIFGETTHNLVAVNGEDGLIDLCKKNNYDIFINDVLNTTSSYMLKLKEILPNCKFVNFEDVGDGSKYADVVFNALYSHSDEKNIYSGYKYYISGKTFMFYNNIKIKDSVKNVLITFGGADPQNYTDRILKIITNNDKFSNIHFTIILGRAKENVEDLLKYNNYSNIDVLFNVSNMAEIMSKNDLAITSRGRTGYELAMLGVPTIAMSQNEREENHEFMSEDNGFIYLGLNPTDDIIEANLEMMIKSTYETRLKYQTLLLSKNLKDGRKRVMGIINNL